MHRGFQAHCALRYMCVLYQRTNMCVLYQRTNMCVLYQEINMLGTVYCILQYKRTVSYCVRALCILEHRRTVLAEYCPKISQRTVLFVGAPCIIITVSAHPVCVCITHFSLYLCVLSQDALNNILITVISKFCFKWRKDFNFL